MKRRIETTIKSPKKSHPITIGLDVGLNVDLSPRWTDAMLSHVMAAVAHMWAEPGCDVLHTRGPFDVPDETGAGGDPSP